MKGTEAVILLKSIEQKYDVMSIKLKGVSVWPFIRLYFKDSISTMRETKASASVIGLVIRCLFAYNPLRTLKRHDVWSFTACDRRKRLGDKMIHRISGAFAAQDVNCLMIEKPLKGIGHYSRKEIEEKDIISEAWLLMLFHIINVYFRWRFPKIGNEALLQKILKENRVDFNYMRYMRILYAQRLAMKILLKLAPKPKMVMIECPYNTMGYLWALHEKSIKIIELQHGSLNGRHLSYCAKAYEPRINPDCVCVFGKDEFNYLTDVKPQYAPEVKITGLYVLDLADNYFRKDIFAEERKVYQSIIVVSGQPSWEIPMSKFIDSVAESHKDLLFVYIPRNRQVDLNFNSENVWFVKGVNIYEYLKWADIHITITSTTYMEAHYFHTPTIFYNYDNISLNYFNGSLLEENGFVFVDGSQQFDEAYNKIYGHHFDNIEFFARNHVKRIMDVINEYIKQ